MEERGERKLPEQERYLKQFQLKRRIERRMLKREYGGERKRK